MIRGPVISLQKLYDMELVMKFGIINWFSGNS